MVPVLVEIREQPPKFLAQYVRVPMSFEVTSRFEIEVTDEGRRTLSAHPRPVKPTWIKNYDAMPHAHPSTWPHRFDLTNWGFLSAHIGDDLVGGVAIAHASPGVEMLNGRDDLAVLWDLRVAAKWRRRGVARALLTATDQWALDRGCREIKVETQNINVPACRLYSSHGFSLSSVDEYAYPELPGEIQLGWSKDLTALPA